MEEQLLPQEVRLPEPQEYIPSKLELLQRHTVKIDFLSRGCVIYVGCKSIPFETLQAGIEALNKYVNDPYNETKKWDKILNN
jgi:hypothetical protein